MYVYIITEIIRSEGCYDNSILKVFENEARARSYFEQFVEEKVKGDDCFFLKDTIENPEEDDYVSFEDDWVHIFCEGSGDSYDLGIIEREAE